MNLAEKLACAYLRLNGFLTLPHFTVFDGDQHNHLDLVALRAANSKEVVHGVTLPTDERLFEGLTALIGQDSKSIVLGVLAEVRTNDDRKQPSEAHRGYAKRFLGDTRVASIAFYECPLGISQNGNVLDVGMRYAGLWIQHRIERMNKENFNLTKAGS